MNLCGPDPLLSSVFGEEGEMYWSHVGQKVIDRNVGQFIRVNLFKSK